MKRLLGLLAVFAVSSCDDIDAALKQRRDADDAGSMGGGAAGGGTATGGGPGGEPDGSVCLNGFCWENPTPQGNQLNAVWGTDAGEVWMVGEVGTVLRWTTAGWKSYQQFFPQTHALHSVWAAGGHVWVVGARGTNETGAGAFMPPMHFDGTAWSPETWTGPVASELLSIRGRDEREVWASGNSSAIARRGDAGVWESRIFEPGAGGNVSLVAIALDSDGRCLVALNNDLRGVAPCDGGALELSLPASYDFGVNALWSSAPGVFRAGVSRSVTTNDAEGGLWLRSPDGGWDSDYVSPRQPACTAGASSPGGFSLAYCGSGGLLLTLESPPVPAPFAGLDTSIGLYGAWTPGALEGSWLVGEGGAQYRHASNNTWQSQRTGPTETVFSLWVDDARVVGVGAFSMLFTRDANSRWSAAAIPSGLGETRDVWFASTATNSYRAFVGVDRMLVEGTSAVTQQAMGVTSESGRQLNGLWGTSATDLWAVGEASEIWHRSAAGWALSSFPTGGPELKDIAGTDDTHAWAVGANCRVLRRDPAADGGWVDESPGCGGSTLYGVWVPPANDAGLEAVAVGPGSQAWFRSSGVWTSSALMAPGNLFKVWGTSATDIWAVGDWGALMHFDGNGWTRVETGTRTKLETLRGRVVGNQLELFIGGEYGTILRRVTPVP